MKTQYKYVVLGCGGIGSGAAYWLARRAGAEVLGLEQFELGHVHGGSQDHSRIIRLTYHHEHYTRLTPHAYTAWAALEAESAVQVVTKTGGIELALTDSPFQQDIEIYAGAMDAAGIPYERFGGDEVLRRFPQFRLDRVAEHPQIIVCNGAGHAYKFAGLLGKILSELAIDGRTEYPIEPFSLQRPAITDPNYRASFHI